MKKMICLPILLTALIICFSASCEGFVDENISSILPPEQIQALQEAGLYEEYINMLAAYGFIDTTDVPSVATPEEDKPVAYTFDGTVRDLLTIESVEIEPYSLFHLNNAEFFTWKMKVRNTSGNDLPMNKSSMRIWYRYLDGNEDILWENYLTAGYSSTIKDNRAEWIEENSYPYGWSKKEFDAVAYLEIYGYATTLHGSPDYEFETPILINIKDYLDIKE